MKLTDICIGVGIFELIMGVIWMFLFKASKLGADKNAKAIKNLHEAHDGQN